MDKSQVNSVGDFDISDFLPYLLNQAAEQTSLQFQAYYRQHYGMLRAEWRVLFHLGKHGELSATDIARMAVMHKTKISRAVHALCLKRFVTRRVNPQDRRQETLFLTARGKKVYVDLDAAAAAYESQITARMKPAALAQLKQHLRFLIRQPDNGAEI